jgi:hypothetical protein
MAAAIMIPITAASAKIAIARYSIQIRFSLKLDARLTKGLQIFYQSLRKIFRAWPS